MKIGSYYDKNLKHINCPKCNWHGAVLNIKTGSITCQYCMYRGKRLEECENE